MTAVVVDASALTSALVGERARASELRQMLRAHDCHAPHLIDAEIGSALRKHVRSGAISEIEGLHALRAAGQVISRRYSHTGALGELAWTLRHALSFYDALYAALAARLRVPLITADARLTRATGLPCTVELV
jgi:predicted nucleic acid-binding protein